MSSSSLQLVPPDWAVLAGLTPPHPSLIMPELYLHYTTVFLHGNKSLGFRIFSDNIVANELKNS